ncbi:MAG TPA: UDP-3-O-(3-hydroxymyristoyl)glucosamine N-acyltransferase [Saprospiraceae bacterium]|nr:UDP-3-O-(3-hydroxymyristoyl)glucosamine N-acyltransferase [Saprospiraceae bacterium]
MRFNSPIPVKEIARLTGSRLVGNADLEATGINEIHKVESGDITFVDKEKYYEKSLSSIASIILIDKETPCPPGKALLICKQPFAAYDRIVRMHRPYTPLIALVDPSAQIHPTATVEPNAVIGRHVQIGADSHIEANVVVRDYCIIGERVIIQSGSIIGSDAFYFKKENNRYHKWTSCGRVIIHDDVYIGACSTIQRGVSGDTVIGRGTKIDCQGHVAHGVVIGEDCLIAAQAAIAGKTIIGNRCTLYGQVGVAQNLVFGDDVTVFAQSGIGDNLESGKSYYGSPAQEARHKLKEIALLKKLPEIVTAIQRIVK